MEIDEHKDKMTVIYYLKGKMDTQSAIQLEEKVKAVPRFFNEMIFDFSGLNYICSMGLRVVLQSYKTMKDRSGKFVCRNIPPEIHSVFEMSGFINIIVRDENAAILKRSESRDSAAYVLIGNLDETKAAELKQELKNISESGRVNIEMDCSKVLSISKEAGISLAEIKNFVASKKGSFVINDLNEEIAKDHRYLVPDKKLENIYIESEKQIVAEALEKLRESQSKA